MATRRFDFKFHCTKDADIIRRLDAQPNKQQYIRQLIATDIMADSLRDAFKIGYSHAVHQAPDPDELMEQQRIDFYNEHCSAINNLDPSINHCDGCVYRFHFKDVDGIEKAACNLEDAWRSHWNHERKTKLSKNGEWREETKYGKE